MGFNLNSFFRDLKTAASGNIFTRYFRMRQVIKEGEEYARACGLIK